MHGNPNIKSRFLLYSAMCKIYAEIKASEIHGDEKSCLCGVSLFVRDRCRYVGKDACLRKYHVNSRNR